MPSAAPAAAHLFISFLRHSFRRRCHLFFGLFLHGTAFILRPLFVSISLPWGKSSCVSGIRRALRGRRNTGRLGQLFLLVDLRRGSCRNRCSLCLEKRAVINAMDPQCLQRARGMRGQNASQQRLTQTHWHSITNGAAKYQQPTRCFSVGPCCCCMRDRARIGALRRHRSLREGLESSTAVNNAYRAVSMYGGGKQQSREQ